MSKRIIAHLTDADPILGVLIASAGPYRLEPQITHSPFRALARAIAHQQLNGTAANTILKRFVENCGTGEFPTPEEILKTRDAKIRAAGFSTAKVLALKDLAQKTLEGIVPESPVLNELSDAEIIERLTQVRGIGRWTVEMMLMFQLGRKDVLPVDDFGVRNGFRLAYGLRKMPSPKALAIYGERWAPHRTAASWYLWRAVDLSKAGTLPVPAERIRLPRLRRAARKVKKALSRKK